MMAADPMHTLQQVASLRLVAEPRNGPSLWHVDAPSFPLIESKMNITSRKRTTRMCLTQVDSKNCSCLHERSKMII